MFENADGCRDCRLGGTWSGGFAAEYLLAATWGRSLPVRAAVAVLMYTPSSSSSVSGARGSWFFESVESLSLGLSGKALPSEL